MNEWHLKVPKTLHVYYGGEKLPYIRMLTVKSFLFHNPDWKVVVWVPKDVGSLRTWKSRELNYPVLCEDCTPELMGLDIERREFDATKFGFPSSMAEVHKSDFLRLFLLATEGGVWSDMDIIYFKPMTSLAVNTIANKDKETFVCISHYGHSAGFLMSAPDSRYYEILTSLARTSYNPDLYQGIGATMFNEHFPKFSDVEAVSPSANIDMDAVYAHDAMKIPDILNGTPSRFTDASIGIHWYAGHPLWGKFIKDTNGGKGDLEDNIIGNVLRAWNE